MKKDIKELLIPHVSTEMFYHLIHVFKDKEEIFMNKDGKLCTNFVTRNLNKVKDTNIHMVGASENDRKEYLRQVWVEATAGKKLVIKDTMNQQRSNAYTSVKTQFASKYIH